MRSGVNRRTLKLFILGVFFCFIINLVSSQEQCEVLERCEGLTCGVDIHTSFTSNNTGCSPCTWDDIGSRFTGCLDGKKTLFYYWKPPATCIPSEQVSTLPLPVHDLPCSLHCTRGTYFNTSTKACESCHTGSFAESSVIRIDTWNKLGLQFSTSCERLYTTGPCDPWRLQGEYIDSGDNRNYHGERSLLQYHVEIVDTRDAYISFEFTVDAERRYDHLTFYVNNQNVMRESQVFEWTTYRYNITKTGFYTFTWVYQKDLSISQGEDMAKLRKIEVSGTEMFATRCQQCRPGTYSDGTFQCRPCAIGTYADERGSSECKQCPPSTTSFIGATSCFAASFPCKSTDYYFEYSACNQQNQRTKTAKWIEPIICDVHHNESTVLPNPSVESCPTNCKPGQFFNTNSGVCEYCPDRTSSHDGSQCTACEKGTASSLKQQFIDIFNKDNFVTRCEGECRSGGWRFMHDTVDSGLGNGVSNSILEFEFQQSDRVSSSYVDITYSMSCLDGEFTFSVDQVQQLSAQCGGCKDLTQFSTQRINLDRKAGKLQNTKITLGYRTRSTLTQDELSCDRIIIKEIAISGSSAGGSATCENCKNGTFSDDFLKCEMCPSGTFSKDTSHMNCTTCPVDTFSYAGASQCIACGQGTNSSIGAGHCTPKFGSCNMVTTIDSVFREFNWEFVSQELINETRMIPQEPGATFHFNLCQKEGHHICPPNSLFCKSYKDGETISLGDELDIKPYDEFNGLLITATNYRQVCVDNSTQQTQPYKTTVKFMCRKSAPEAVGGPLIVRKSQCHYEIQIARDGLCPLCTEEDFYESAGVCEDGKQTIRYLPRIDAKHLCNGGIDLSSKVIQRDCTQFVVPFPLWAIVLLVIAGIVLLVVIVALVLIAGVFFYMYRDVSMKYNRMQDDNMETNQRM